MAPHGAVSSAAANQDPLQVRTLASTGYAKQTLQLAAHAAPTARAETAAQSSIGRRTSRERWQPTHALPLQDDHMLHLGLTRQLLVQGRMRLHGKSKGIAVDHDPPNLRLPYILDKLRKRNLRHISASQPEALKQGYLFCTEIMQVVVGGQL